MESNTKLMLDNRELLDMEKDIFQLLRYLFKNIITLSEKEISNVIVVIFFSIWCDVMETVWIL